MARNLTSIPETDAPNAEYPSGRIRNEDSPIVGTPVIEELYGDIIQFFHKLVRLAGITLNGLPENETNTFQFITALQAFIRTITGTSALKGVWQSASNAETQAGLIDSKVVTPQALHSKQASSTARGLIKQGTGSLIDSGLDIDPGNNALCVPPSELIRVLGGLLTKIVSIGDWNMQTTSTKFVAHGISDWTKIREIHALIRNDADNERHTFDGLDGHSRALSVNIELEITSSRFVSSDYNSTSYNRGFIIIRYLH